jgi:hypothetical protein
MLDNRVPSLTYTGKAALSVPRHESRNLRTALGVDLEVIVMPVIIIIVVPIIVLIIIKEIIVVVIKEIVVVLQSEVADILESHAAGFRLVFDLFAGADALVPEHAETGPTNDVRHLSSPFASSIGEMSPQDRGLRTD